MEFNEEFALKYGLRKDEDYWFHKPSSHWIVKHDACVKIADQESITLTMGIVLESRDSHKSVVVHGSMGESTVEMVGECHVGMQPISKEYPWCLAQKRGEDRCILRLVAPGGGIYSEIEADDFKQSGAPLAAPTSADPPRKNVPAEDAVIDKTGLPAEYLSGVPDINSAVTFGKHKGRTWAELLSSESGYLQWIVAQAQAEHGENWAKWSKAAINALVFLAEAHVADKPEPESQEDIPF